MKYYRISSHLLVLFVLVAACSQVAATPAYRGYTGLMLTPTADTLKTGGFDFGAVFLSNDTNDTTFFSGNIGILDSLEVGGAVISPEHGDSNGIINAKYGLLKETMTAPALAIGWSDVADQLDSTPYVVLSKSLTMQGTNSLAPRLHVGVGSGSLDGVFAGLSARIAEQLQLMIEYDTNDVNFGLQFAAAQGLRLHAGLVGGDNLGLGASYNVGF